ncbi:MAG: hypothetical protein EZS28_011649 [Streblomastix strix]|uniref:Uncharacterized protein n=1 Tax=Streblomastix strix TaxID=222440 RepID=A0A5J4WD14_9EUKA|nr:MAG: hypothetical protein EZS28_011649 [Streblomastix strix]
MWNRLEIDGNIPEMNMKLQRVEYQNIRKEKVKNVTSTQGLLQQICKNKKEKKRQLAALIDILNFLRPQIKEVSLYLIDLDNEKKMH